MPRNTKQKNKSTISNFVDWITRNIWLFIVILLAVAVFFIVTDLFWHWWDWAAITAIATWILASSIFIAIWQQFESKKRARIEFTERRLELLNSKDLQEGLDIAQKKRPLKLSDLPENDQVKLRHSLELLQSLGLLVKLGYAEKELAIIEHRGKYIKCWYVLKLLFDYERKARGKYGEGIEYLAKESYKYQIQHIPRNEWVKLNHKICEIDIL
jgi:hypothetical protein